MKRQWCSLLALLFGGQVFAQQSAPVPIETGLPTQSSASSNGFTPASEAWNGDQETGRGFLTGDRAFPNFIGYVSNPSLAVDPRSQTQLYPIYSHASMSAIRPFP